MANTFGAPGTGFPLIDPRCIRSHRERYRRAIVPELEWANSYYSTLGRWPDVGWLLLDRLSYDQINPYATNLQLIIQDFTNPALTISNLTVVQARCVTHGIESDSAAIYLIQVTNTQGVLYNPWFQFPTSSQYNVRAPAYDTGYYSGSLSGGVTAWTWDTMVADLWAQAGGLLGTYPGLPSTPLSAPENFIFVGVSLFESINKVLDLLGMGIAGNYPSHTIVNLGSADAVYTAQAAAYAKYLEDVVDYVDTGSGRVPSQVIIYFHRRNQYYGTEETVRKDSPQWQNTPSYSVTVPATSQFVGAAGTAYLWADFTVRYDMNGAPLAADVATAAAIAVERASQYFNKIYRATQGFAKFVYSGILPFTTGSLVDGVRWYNTGVQQTGLNDLSAGWRTETIRGYVWDEVTFPLNLMGLTGPD